MAKRRRRRRGLLGNVLLTAVLGCFVAGVGVWVLWRVTRPAPEPRFAPPTPVARGPLPTPTEPEEIGQTDRARLEAILDAKGKSGTPRTR